MQRLWWSIGVVGAVGVLVGLVAQLLLAQNGLLAGGAAAGLTLASLSIGRAVRQRRYRLTREQAYRLHQKMLAYASDDGWRTPGNV